MCTTWGSGFTHIIIMYTWKRGDYSMKKPTKGKLTIRQKLELMKTIAQRNEQRRKEFKEQANKTSNK